MCGSENKQRLFPYTALTGWVFSRIRKIAENYYQFRHVRLSVRPSVRMQQLGSHWMDFHEICYLSLIFMDPCNVV